MSQYTINPLSMDEPTEAEIKQNDALTEWLKKQGVFESREDMVVREEVLIFLVELIKSWVKKVAAQKGMSELAVEEANAELFTFGSFRLGVHGPGDDIDTHCIGPKWCDRHGDFFGTNPWSLQQLLTNSAHVKKIQAVSESFVPVLKLDIRGIDIDLTYAQLPLLEVPGNLDVQDDNILRGMDEASVTSINGCRVTDKIVQLVPNKESFSNALRFLKLWGKCRGIYSNVMGYLGGVNFALLVTYVCILYPNACASVIIAKFFRIYCLWSWTMPIRLTDVKTGGSMSQMVWDPAQNRRDALALFPIITPCYPASNSTYNVSVRC